MKKINIIILAVILTAVLMIIPVSAEAEEVAVSMHSKNFGLSDMLNSSLSQLYPIIQQNGLAVTLEEDILFPAQDREMLQARFLNLFLNAAAYAPKSGRLIVGYDRETETIFIRVPQKDMRFDVEREITDVQGNVFYLKTIQGEEALYNFKI